MRMMLPFVLLAAACARKREPAPTEMVDLVRFLFEHWEEPEILPEAMDNLGSWLDRNIDSEEAEDGFELEPLLATDVASVERPDRPLSELLGASGAAASAFPVEDHAGHIVLSDQMWSNPTQLNRYDRTVVGGNRSAFERREDVLRTSNAVETSTLGITIPYTLLKDYRWVEGETTTAIVARSWTEEQFCNDGGGNCLEQSFSIDLFVADGANTSRRMTATWSEVESSIALPDATLIASLAMGIQNVFEATDEFLATQ